MKKVFSKCKKFALLALTLVLALVSVTTIALNTVKADVKAASTSTSYYSMSYENNKLSILLNGDITAYSSVSKDDLSTLKDAIKDYVFDIVKDDLNFGIDNNNGSRGLVKSGRTIRFTDPGASGVDVSLLSNIIASQLSDKEDVNDNLLGDGLYDTLIEFYVDRYVETYVSDNNVSDSDKAQVYTDVANQLTTALTNAAVTAYGSEASQAPTADIASYVQTKVTEVSNMNANGEHVEVTLSDVSDIVNTIEDVDKVVEVVNSSAIDVTSEINTIITTATADEITDFLKEVPTSTIASVIENTSALNGDEVKTIVSTIGMENLIEVANQIGESGIQELLEAADLDSDDVQEIIDTYSSEIDLGTILKAVTSIKLDSNLIYDEDGINGTGLKAVIKDLVSWAKNMGSYTDDTMKKSYNVTIETSLGTVEFELEAGFYGDSSLLRKVVNKLAEYVDYANVDGTYTLTINVPEVLADLFNDCLTDGTLSEEIKTRLFEDSSLTIEELYTKFNSTTLDEYVTLLKGVDYEKLIDKFLDPQTWNDLFDTTIFTESNIDKVINKAIAVVKKLQNFDYDKFKDVLGLSTFDNTPVETLINTVNEYLNKINLDNIDADYLRNYTNQQASDKLDKLAAKTETYDKIKSYVEKVYNKLPDSWKAKSLVDFYSGNGVFNGEGTFDLNNLLGSFSSISKILDYLPDTVKVDLTVNGVKLYKVTYNYGLETKVGFLPEGTDITKYAPTEIVDGTDTYQVYSWKDDTDTEVTAMPASDTTLTAEYVFVVSESEGYTGTYDKASHEISVTVKPASNDYTYQWYKDGVEVAGATSDTLALTTVAESGNYTCKVTKGSQVVESNEITVSISKCKIDVSKYTWDYTTAFTYDGKAHKVQLTNVDTTVVKVTYTNNSSTNAFTSKIATAKFTLIDSANYELSAASKTLSWKINKATIDVSGYTWNYTDAYTYDGTAKTVALASYDTKLLKVTYTGNTNTNAGTYTASVTFTPTSTTNYQVSGSVEDLSWTINKAAIDVSGYTWDYTDAFTYDTFTKKVELTNVSEYVKAIYANAEEKNAGTYNATVTFESVNANYDVTGSVEGISWTINKGILKVSDYVLAQSEYTYDGTEKEVSLADYNVVVIKSVDFDENAKKTDAGTYTTKATFTLRDAYVANYDLDQTELTFTWTIKKATITNLSFKWNTYSAFIYNNGKDFKVEGSVNLTDSKAADYRNYVEVSYTDNTNSQAGSYTAKAKIVVKAEYANNYEYTSTEYTKAYTISKATIDVSTYKWNYTEAYAYDGTEKKVELTNVNALVNVTYADNAKTLAGSYTATATLTAKDSTNYELVGNTTYTLAWAINKATVSLDNLTWTDSSKFVYDGQAKEVVITNLPEGVSVTYTNNSNANAGTYTATATFASENYELSITSATQEYTIAKATIDLSTYTLEWNYTTPFTEDGTVKEVTLKTVPTGLTATYSMNKGTNAGTYTAKVTLTSTDANYEVVGTAPTCTWVINAKAETPVSNDFASEDGKVEVTSTNGVPESYTLETSDQTENYADLDLSSVLEDGQRGKVASATDIHFSENGTEQHVSGDTFTVRMEIPADLIGKDIAVIHIADDNTITVVSPITIDGNYVEFSTEGFSVFAIIELVNVPHIPAILWVLFGILMAAAIGIAIYFILIKNKKEENAAEATEASENKEATEEIADNAESEENFEESFFAELVKSGDENKSFYDQIKDLVMAFDGVTDSINWHYETFSTEDGTVIVKFKMKNGKLYVTIPGVDPDNTYACIKNAKRCTNAKANIAEVIAKLGLAKKEQPVEEAPAQEEQATETPVEETPAEEEAPAQEEQAAEETPVEETPAEEQPVEEAPVEEQPAEETPAEETPAEENNEANNEANNEVVEEKKED